MTPKDAHENLPPLLRKNPWMATGEDLMAAMVDGAWYNFDEYSNIHEILRLLNEGRLETDPSALNRVGSMSTSLTVRIRKKVPE